MNHNIDISEILAGGSIVLITFLVILAIAWLVFYYICFWKLFKKAGKKGWEAIIPFYNTYTLIEIAGLHWWYFLIALIGSITVSLEIENITWIFNIVNIVINFFIFYNLAKKMHKEPIAIGVCGALVSEITIPVLALAKNFEYDSSVKVNPNGPIGEHTKNGPQRFCLGCGQELKPSSVFCENCGKKVE